MPPRHRTAGSCASGYKQGKAVLECTSAPPYHPYLTRTHTSTMFAASFHGYTAHRLAADGGGQRYGCFFFRNDLRTTAPSGNAASAGHEAGGRRSATRRPRQVPSAGSGGAGGGGRALWRVSCLRGRRCHCCRRSQGVLEWGVRESVVLTGSLFFFSWMVVGAMRGTTARLHCEAGEGGSAGIVP